MALYRSRCHSPLDANPTKYRGSGLSPLDANPTKYRSRESSPTLYSGLGLYFYIGERTSPIRIARINRSTFAFVDYASFSTDLRGNFSRSVLRKINNRNIAYKDANGNIYSGGGNGQTPHKIIKFNLGTMTETASLLINTGGTPYRPIYEGVIDSAESYSYWLNLGNHYYGEKTLQKVDMTNFSLVTSITGPVLDTTRRTIEIDEANNRLLVLEHSYSPYYFLVNRYSINPFAFVDTITNIVAGASNNAYGSPCLTRVGTKILFVGYYSTTASGLPGRLVRCDLPNLTNVSTLVFGVAEGSGVAMVVDSAGQYAYVVAATATKFSVLKFDITTTPMTKIGSVEISHDGLMPGSLGIDELSGHIYFSDTNLMGKVHKISISPFAYVGYMNMPLGHYAFFDTFFED